MSTMMSQITTVSIMLLNRLFRLRSKKTSKFRVTGLCEGNSPVTDEFPTQRASNVEMFLFDNVIMMIAHNLPAAHGPECIPMRSSTGKSGRCRILNFMWHALSKSRAKLAISPTWRLPLCTGRPLTTMYESPMVSTLKHTAWWRHNMDRPSELMAIHIRRLMWNSGVFCGVSLLHSRDADDWRRHVAHVI